MPSALQQTVDRLSATVKQFTVAQRVFAVIAAAAVIVAAYGLYTWASKPTMTPLFSGLAGADASAVVDQLSADGVKYSLTDGGSTVMVPTASVYGERIKLAAKGLPANSDGSGYSLLDKLSATSTQFQEQTTYQRALEGELAKTIKAMSGVQSASVKLAIPTDSVFTDQQKDPTASVFVRETAGTKLDANQVQAIVHLVSAGISGMKPADVAVVDADGNVLSTVGATAGSGAMADQQTSDYESKVEAAVHKLLDPLVGASNVTVTATALLNYDTSQKTIESYTASPTTPPLASSTKTEEYTGSGSSSATGILGPDNIAVPSGTSPTGNGAYKSTSQDLTNAVDKTTEVVTAAPGTLQRQSVAVAINSTAGAALDMTNLQSAIAAAAGIDANRGDSLSVQRMPFDTTAAKAAQTALAAADKQAKAEATTNLIKQGAIGAVVLFVVLGLVIAGARRAKRANREALDLGRLEAAAAQREQAMIDAAAGGELPIGAIDAGPRQPDPIEAKRRQVAALVDEQPSEVADLLRGWLTDTGSRR